MIFGEKLKEAVKRSGRSDEEIAAAAEMSLGNLYKVYKRDSIETRYLVKICNLLGVSMDYFFQDQLAADFTNTGQANYANQVGKNKQAINVGSDDCPQRLQALQEKYALLEKTVADKDLIIELLRGQR